MNIARSLWRDKVHRSNVDRFLQFSDRRTLKAVQMKYYALTSPDQRGPGKSPGKAKSNREE